MSEILHIYTRVSTSAQEDDGTSLDTQRDLGTKKAKDLGMLPRVWNEGGQSSKHDDLGNRPVLAALLTEIEAGKAKHIWVFNTDRLSRNENTWSAIRLKLLQNDVRLYTSNGMFQLSNPLDKLLLGILSEISAYDNYLRAERARLGKLNRLREGYWIGGRTPFGYRIEDRKLVPEPDEAKWVKFIFEEYIKGKSIQMIRSSLIKAAVLPRGGNRIWSTGSIEILMQNTHFRGFYKVRDKKSGEEFTINCDPIISPALYDQYLESRERRSRRRVVESNLRNFYLLRDFLVCARCESFLSGRIYPRQYRAVYYCPRQERRRDDPYSKHLQRCGMGAYLRIEETDEIVWRSVVEVMSNSHRYKEEIKQAALGAKGPQKDRKQAALILRKRIKGCDSERLRIERMIATTEAAQMIQGDKKTHYEAVIQTLRQEVITIDQRRAEISRQLKDVETESRWTDWMSEFGTKITALQQLSGEPRKEFLKGVIDTIKVEKIDPDRGELTILFRHPYVNDRFVKCPPTEDARKYRIEDGEVSTVVHLDLTRRKGKKSENRASGHPDSGLQT